jgi:quinol monooxygenase YgiN
MSVTILLRMRVKEESITAFEEGFAAMLPDTRAYDGCRKVEVHRQLDSPTTYMAVEEWDSKEHYERYLEWRNQSGTLGLFAETLSEPPALSFLEPLEM